MGVVLPSYLDEALDLIGVSWPNVDEDDYRAMANSMREFASSLESGTCDLHASIQDMLGVNEGPAVEALAAHWDKVKGKHLTGLADIGRAAGDGLDAVALLIEGAKLAAIAQLGILAAEIAAAVAAAPVTLGLSSLAGLAGTQVCRIAVKRIFREVEQQVVEEIMSRVTAPIEEAIGAMVGDLVVQTGSQALGLQDDVNLGKTVQAGKESLHDAGKASLQIASAASGGGGGSGGGSGAGKIDVDLQSYTSLENALKRAGDHFDGDSMSHFHAAKRRQGATRGKDSIANAVNSALDTALEGIEKGVKKAAKHVGEDMKSGVGKMRDNHRDNDEKIAHNLHKIQRREPTRDELRQQLGETPVYLLNDRGKMQRLTRNGPADLTDSDRELLGIPLKLTGSNKDRLPPRPRNPNNPYAWDPKDTPEQRKERPRKQSTKVPFYEDELSRATALARHEQNSYGNYEVNKETRQPKFTSNNYAAARVEYGHEGEHREFILVGRSRNPVHSEKVLGVPFLENGTGRHVKDLYTEREPCSESSDCAAWIQKYMPHVNVTHSVDFGPGTMESGNREMEDRLNRMYPGERPAKRSPWTNFQGLHPQH
jgi:hypothetical protein